MTTPTTIVGDLVAKEMRFALVAARFNELVVDRLIEGAMDTLLRHGAQRGDLTVVRVPGAFELPLAAQRLAAGDRYDAVIALGAVIRGQTSHFDYVCSACTQGLGRVALDRDKPVAFGVLTTETLEQAMERAGSKAGNKGAEAAAAAVEMVSLLRRLET